MKKAAILILAVVTHYATFAQQGVIVKQSAGVSTFFYTSTFSGDDIEAALDQCNPLGGDTLLLPGGTFHLVGTVNNLVIDRPVVIIGAGYSDASNSTTTSTVISGTNDVVLYHNSDGTSIHGIDFDMSNGRVYFVNSSTQNVSFFRCRFRRLDLGDGSFGVNSQIHIQECWMESFRGSDATSVTVDNCIIGTPPQTFTTGGLTMRNSVIHNWGNFSAGAGNSYYNCVFMRNSAGAGITEASCYNDCLFITTGGAMTQGSATCMINCGSNGLSGVYVDVPSITDYSYQSDYHVILGGPADLRSADIYQGPTPWKDGAVPFNPHWTGLTVPGSANGGLIPNVVIQGEAQTH